MATCFFSDLIAGYDYWTKRYYARGSNPNSGMNVCNRMDFTINGDLGLFSPRGPKLTVMSIINQSTIINKTKKKKLEN